MLVEELEAFAEVQANFELLESTYTAVLKKQAEAKKEMQEISQSPQNSFGFFNKVSKEDLLTELRGKLTGIESDIYVIEKTIGTAAEVMVRHGIPLIRNRKRERFEEIVREFALPIQSRAL